MTRATTAAAVAALLVLAPPALAAQGQVVRLPERDRALAGEATVAFAIGRAEGAEHEMFADVTGVAFDASDNLYVLDRQNARVMVYDRAGRFVRQVGKKGQGPGELAVPMSMAVSPDGTVALYDMGMPGFVHFAPDGTYLRGRRLDAWRPMFTAGTPFAWHPRGGLVGTFTPRGGTDGTFAQTLGTALVMVPAGEGAEARVFDLPQAVRIEGSSSAPGQQTVRVQGPPVFSPQASFGVLPDGSVAMSFTNGYTVRIVDMAGTTLRYIQRPVRPRLVTEDLREAARERQREMRRSGRGMISIRVGGGGGGAAPPVDRAAIERGLGEMRFADTLPAVRGLRVAPSGTIWVERTSEGYYEPGPIDLLAASGEYRGTVTGIALPAALSRGGLAAFIEPGEDDVPRVVVRRIPREWR